MGTLGTLERKAYYSRHEPDGLSAGWLWGWEKVVEDASRKKPKDVLERLTSTSFPPAAIAGALVSFAGAALGKPSQTQRQRSQDRAPAQIGQAPVPIKLEIEYTAPAILQTRLRQSLSGIAVGPADKIFVLGDGE